MARIGIPGKSRKPKDKNVLKTISPNNSRGSRYSNNSRRSRKSGSSGGLRSPNNSRSSGKPLSSIWSRNQGPKKPRSPIQLILMAIIIIAFICGLALGISMIFSGDDPGTESGGVEYMNVTNNITVYENSSYDLKDENGTQISYYDFDENVTEGQNITAYNVSSSANVY